MTKPRDESGTRIEGMSRTVLTVFGTTTPLLRTRSAKLILAVGRLTMTVRDRFIGWGIALGTVTTPTGWSVLVLAVAATVTWLWFGWAEAMAIAAGACSLVTVCALFLVGHNSVDVRLEVPEPRTVVGRPVEATVRLIAGRRGIGWSPRVEVQLGQTVLHLTMRRENGGTGVSTTFEVPAVRRAVIDVGPVRTVRGDPVGLFRRAAVWTSVVPVHVHPRTVVVPRSSTGQLRDLEGGVTMDLTAADLAFHALREYRPGDDRRHIHWKSTARTGELTVRQFEETRRSHVAIAFGLATEDCADDEEFEFVISAAASIALRSIRDGGDVTVVTSPDRLPFGAHRSQLVRPRALSTRSPERLLDGISGLVRGVSDVPLGQLAALAARDIDGVSLVYLVCGSTPSVRELRLWSMRFPPAVQTVAVVCSSGHVPELFRVQELSVLTIGYLEDLRRALANGRTT